MPAKKKAKAPVKSSRKKTAAKKPAAKSSKQLKSVMPASNPADSISSIMQEHRLFPPAKEFSAKAHISSQAQLQKIREKAAKNPVAFWEEQAKALTWFKPSKTAL